MEQVLVNESSLQDIANAIREKTGGTEPILPSEMSNVIRAIEIGGAKTATGTYTPSAASSALAVTGLDFDPYALVVRAPVGTVSSGLALGAGTPSGAWCTSYIYLQDASYAHSNGQGTLTLSGTTFVKGKTYTWFAVGV